MAPAVPIQACDERICYKGLRAPLTRRASIIYRVRLSRTSQGVVKAVNGNRVTVRLDGDGLITTSVLQDQHVAVAKADAVMPEMMAVKKRAKKG
jgi:hypothetical protein